VPRLRGVLWGASGAVALGFALTLGRALYSGDGVGAAFAAFVGLSAAVVIATGLIAPRLLRGRIRGAG